MAAETAEVRPAVISEDSKTALDEYRGFRHVVRHVYTFRLDPEKLQRLIDDAPVVLATVSKELLAFAGFLERAADTRPMPQTPSTENQ